MSDQALLASASTSSARAVTMSWSEPYRSHLWGDGRQKNRRDGGDSARSRVAHLTENHQLSCDSPGKTEGVNWTSFSPLHPYFQVIQCRGWGFKRHLNSFRTPETHPCITVTGLIALQSSQMPVVSTVVGHHRSSVQQHR